MVDCRRARKLRLVGRGLRKLSAGAGAFIEKGSRPAAMALRTESANCRSKMFSIARSNRSCLTASVVGALAPQLQQAEIDRAKRKPTDNLDAYDYFLRATARFHHWTEEATGEALGLCHKAIQLDPDFASACALAAFCYLPRKVYGWITDRDQEVAEAKRLALRAAELGGGDADALVKAGYVLARVVGELEGGAAFIDRALALNPNLAAA